MHGETVKHVINLAPITNGRIRSDEMEKREEKLLGIIL
jgi:hypothetical protein